MIGIYIIFALLFPICVLYGIRKKKTESIVLLDKTESMEIRGIATCFVIMAHTSNLIIENDIPYAGLLRVFSVLGGMGVLLFFFISGYGIYKGYADKKPSVEFLKKRILNVVIPYLMMKICFSTISLIINIDKTSLKDVALGFLSDWFIDVILIQYLLFYFSWKLSRHNDSNDKTILCITNFIFNIIVAVIFWRAGLIARWYNGLLLFPFGMLVAHYEKNIIVIWNKRWWFNLALSTVIFLVLSITFTISRGNLWGDFAKTFAGIFLSLIVCEFFVRYKLNSKIMQYIGKDSLYYYIVHLSMITILSDMQLTNVILEVYFILILTFVAVTLFTFIWKKMLVFLKGNSLY